MTAPYPPSDQPPTGPPGPPGYLPGRDGMPVPGAGYPAPPPKKRRTWLWVLLGAAGLIALLCCGGIAVVAISGDDSEPAAVGAPSVAPVPTTKGAGKAAPPAPPAEAPKRAGAAAVGTAVRDGKFEFVVQKVVCGQATIGTEYLRATAQGQFCLVTLSVKNIGAKPQSFSHSSQKAFGASGLEYGTDGAASLYANTDQQVWLKEINPGNMLEGVIVFDIPKDATISELELHDSIFSSGTRVLVS